jgi:fucose permease
MLVTMLALGPLMDRFGKKPPMVLGPLLVALALTAVAGAADYGILLAAVVLLGAGGGAVNSATNTLIADLHTDPRRKNAALNLLGIFFGIGAIFLPFTIGSLLAFIGLAAILYAALTITLVPAVLSAALPFPPPHGDRVPLAETARLARHPGVLTFGLLLFFESGNEFILAGYTSTFLTRELHSTVGHASFLLALYWGSVIAARFALSRLLLAVEGGITVMASAAAAAAGVGLLSIARTEWMAAGALILTGCGVASIFPTTLGLAGTRFAEHSGTVFGLLFAIALTGGMSLPWALGHFAATSFRLALLLPAAGFVAIFVIQAALIGRQSTPPAPE